MSRNRINLLKTFAIKNELLNANLLVNNTFELNNQIKGKATPVHVHENIRVKYSKFNFDNVSRISYLQVNGQRYKKGLCVQLNDNEEPTFGLINEIFVRNNESFIGCQILQTMGFNSLYFGFSIAYEDSFQIIPFDSLFQSHILYSIHKCAEHNILVRVR